MSVSYSVSKFIYKGRRRRGDGRGRRRGRRRDYVRGFGYQGRASREGWSREIAEMSVGAEFKDALCEPGNWQMGITAFGEMLPYAENKITLNRNKKDKWGLPVLDMDVEIKDNEKRMRVDMMNVGDDHQIYVEQCGNPHGWIF